MKQVVIEIDDELYANINEPTNDEDLLRYIIKRGILLPEDHGDLKDASELDILSWQGKSDDFADGVMWAMEQLDTLPVLIPRKKGDSCTNDTD